MAWSRTSGATLVAGIVFLLVCVGAGAAGSQALLLLNSGMAHERLGQHEEALADFGRALAAGGLSKADRVRTTFDRGVALDALERTAEAISEYSAALKLDARFAPALNNRANAYRRLGRLADAKNDYMAALASAQTSREYPYYGLGRIAEAQGDTKGRAQILRTSAGRQSWLCPRVAEFGCPSKSGRTGVLRSASSWQSARRAAIAGRDRPASPRQSG